MASKGKSLLAKEKDTNTANKRPLVESDAVAGPVSKVPKVAAKAVAVPKADVAPKALAVPKVEKKKVVSMDVIITKLSEVISDLKSKEEKDEAYNKLKLEEVKQFLDTMSRPNIMKAVSEIVLTAEDAANLLNLLLDGLGESTKHGNKMVFAVMKTIVKNLENREAVQVEKFAEIMGVLHIHSQCQLSMKQYGVMVEHIAGLMM